MENVLAAVIVIFVLLFGALSLSSTFISAQQVLSDAWQAMTARDDSLAHTSIIPERMRILEYGSIIEVTLRNDGTLKLADFDQWDVFTEHYDGSAEAGYYTGRLSYTPPNAALSNSHWKVDGIYLDAENLAAERYEPGILNTGEEIVLRLQVAPAIGVGKSVQATITTANGVRASIMGTRNTPPALLANTGLKVGRGGTATIRPDLLTVTDADNEPSELTYTVLTPPAPEVTPEPTPAYGPEHGIVAPETFTQAQLNDGEVVYTHTDVASPEQQSDHFEFTVSDGIDLIGPYSFVISVNRPPRLAQNLGLALPAGGSATITSALLQATDDDVDDPAGDLIYTVLHLSGGTLSLGSTFSQADIDNNRLSYTHVGSSAEQFDFVISDGYDVIGSYRFLITLVP
jgi:hypothetical protein